MLVFAVIVWGAFICAAFLALAYGAGHTNGFAQAMKENGWKPSQSGWTKEIP